MADREIQEADAAQREAELEVDRICARPYEDIAREAREWAKRRDTSAASVSAPVAGDRWSRSHVIDGICLTSVDDWVFRPDGIYYRQGSLIFRRSFGCPEYAVMVLVIPDAFETEHFDVTEEGVVLQRKAPPGAPSIALVPFARDSLDGSESPSDWKNICNLPRPLPGHVWRYDERRQGVLVKEDSHLFLIGHGSVDGLGKSVCVLSGVHALGRASWGLLTDGIASDFSYPGGIRDFGVVVIPSFSSRLLSHNLYSNDWRTCQEINGIMFRLPDGILRFEPLGKPKEAGLTTLDLLGVEGPIVVGEDGAIRTVEESNLIPVCGAFGMLAAGTSIATAIGLVANSHHWYSAIGPLIALLVILFVWRPAHRFLRRVEGLPVSTRIGNTETIDTEGETVAESAALAPAEEEPLPPVETVRAYLLDQLASLKGRLVGEASDLADSRQKFMGREQVLRAKLLEVRATLRGNGDPGLKDSEIIARGVSALEQKLAEVVRARQEVEEAMARIAGFIDLQSGRVARPLTELQVLEEILEVGADTEALVAESRIRVAAAVAELEAEVLRIQDGVRALTVSYASRVAGELQDSESATAWLLRLPAADVAVSPDRIRASDDAGEVAEVAHAADPVPSLAIGSA